MIIVNMQAIAIRVRQQAIGPGPDPLGPSILVPPHAERDSRQ
jgi:hypothetical protein